jgi:hypothetical protein
MDEAVTASNAAADKQAEAESEVVRKEDALKDGQEQIAALQKQLVDANETIKHHENMLEIIKRNGVDLNSLMAPSPINGVVQRVVPDLRLAIISVGKDDGVQEGFKFTVFRGGEFIGEGVVQDVYQDNASIRIMRTAPGKSVQVNDQATTRL